ncbi:MAG: S1 RNA-binding domain-containing protein [Bdellovibrionaceae bacterium]|nr:S1 RNA-binding domain-containing protein [Pseudobdellovibrionaceae bacterium]
MTTKRDAFGDEIKTNEGDFASLFEQSMTAGTRKLKKGDEFRGEIVSLHGDSVFVSTGTPMDGVLPKAELLNDDKQITHKVGDVIEVVVVRVTHDEILLRYKSARMAASTTDSLEDAFDMEIPVEGRVIEQVKGGFRVEIQKKLAFCPISQIDAKPDSDPTVYLNKKFEFLITQFENNGRNIVVSRRRILDLQKAENEGSFLQKFKVGDIITGRITKLEAYGAFVEIQPGVEGLVHISELAWGRVQNPSDVVAIGQSVQAKILKIDDGDRMKISLSIKEGGTAIDPWTEFEKNYPPGTKIKGTVEKKEVFGYFITIVPGINGLFPRSKWRDSVDAKSYDNKSKGDVLDLQIEQIDPVGRKVLLALTSEEIDESWKQHTSSSSGPKRGLGTFGDLLAKAQTGAKKK